MRSSITLVAAAAVLGFTAASPFERRYEECKAPQQWYTCGDGWQGCCSVLPCKGPAEGVKSHCPDEAASLPTPVKPIVSTTTSKSTPTSYASATPAATPALAPDTDWMKKCKEDDSNCNWAARFFTIQTDNETYTTFNSTSQFHVAKGTGHARLDSIALFTNIPPTVTSCVMKWYKPSRGIFYGTWRDGAMNISTLDMGGKPFAEAVGSTDISYKNMKPFIASKKVHGVLDLGNWGRTAESAFLTGPKFACKGPELAVHFALNAQMHEGSVTVDQVSKLGQNMNNYVQRAGWFLSYE